jgi:hypothetical protein
MAILLQKKGKFSDLFNVLLFKGRSRKVWGFTNPPEDIPLELLKSTVHGGISASDTADLGIVVSSITRGEAQAAYNTLLPADFFSSIKLSTWQYGSTYMKLPYGGKPIGLAPGTFEVAQINSALFGTSKYAKSIGLNRVLRTTGVYAPLLGISGYGFGTFFGTVAGLPRNVGPIQLKDINEESK